MPYFMMIASPRMFGFRKAKIPAREAAIAGVWSGGKPWTPDVDAVRAALPTRLRKALDRSGGAVWHDKHTSRPSRLYLTDYRGKPLYTLNFLFREEE